jgi:hypothetical protein
MRQMGPERLLLEAAQQQRRVVCRQRRLPLAHLRMHAKEPTVDAAGDERLHEFLSGRAWRAQAAQRNAVHINCFERHAGR